ncbi:unnamed protein product [Amoebophrya sp. A120]|nr:unnamed protein product [Amoebophrya sp. A120]|eukprot:GSA120T00004648001.1
MASATAHAKREMLDQLQQAMWWPVSSSATTGKITTTKRSIGGGSSASSSSYSTSFLSSENDPATSGQLTSSRNTSRDFAFSPASPFSPTSDRSRTSRTNTVVHMKTKARHLPSKSGTTSFYAQIPKVPLCEDLDDQVLRKGEACFSDCGKTRGKQKCPQRVLEHGLGFSKDEECKSTVECVAEDRVLCQANKGGVAEAGFDFFAAAPAAFAAATTTSTTLVEAASSTSSAAAATTAATSASGVQTTFSAGLGLLSLFLSALPEFGVAVQQQQQTAASSTSVVTSGTTTTDATNPLTATTTSITGIDSQYFDEGTLTAGSEEYDEPEPYFEPLPEPEQDEVTSKEDEDQKNTTGGTAASSTTSNAAASFPDKHNRPKNSCQQNQINQFKQPKNNLDLESLCHGLAGPGSGKNSASTTSSSSSFRATGGNKMNPIRDHGKNSGRSGTTGRERDRDHRQLLEFDADGEVIF